MIRRIAAALALAVLMLAGWQAPSSAATTYYYAAGVQGGFATEPTSMFANMSGLNPTLDSTGPDYESHTVLQLAMTQGSGGTLQSSEVGLRKASGDASMKIFGYFWRNGSACGYSLINLCGTTYDFNQCDTVGGVNNCGQSTDNWDIGSAVASGTVMRMGIEHIGTDIWLTAYQNGGTFERLGWLDKAFYTSAGITYNSADEIKAYGEVAPGGGALGCTDMGNGSLPATPASGAIIGSISVLPNTITVDIDQAMVITDATKYNAIPTVATPHPNVRTLLISGPGAC